MNRSVKPTMDRAKVTLASLLPALLLLLGGQGLAAAFNDCSSPGCGNPACAMDGGKPCPSHPLVLIDISARTVNPRFGKQFGKGGTPPLLLHSPSLAVNRAPVAISAQNGAPLALAACWQFACRAALEPRAPSSVR